MKKYYLKEDVDFERLGHFYFENIDDSAWVNCDYFLCQAISVSTKTREITFDKGRYGKDILKQLKEANLVEERDE